MGDLEPSVSAADLRFLALLRGHYWHRTSWKNLKAILSAGAILPNDGRFNPTYPQSRRSFAWNECAISLFDFKYSTDAQALEQPYRWMRFFADQQPVTVAIRLNLADLESSLIPNDAARARWPSTKYQEMWIPNVEVWSRQAIPVSCFDGCLLTFGRLGARQWVDRADATIEVLFATAQSLMRGNRDWFRSSRQFRRAFARGMK